MDWAQVIAIVGTNIGLCAVVGGFIIWAINRMDSDVKAISERMDADIKAIGNRLDGLGNRLDSHAQRIDQLYHMFVDLLKEVKKS